MAAFATGRNIHQFVVDLADYVDLWSYIYQFYHSEQHNEIDKINHVTKPDRFRRKTKEACKLS
jgi:hypothetical protein